VRRRPAFSPWRGFPAGWRDLWPRDRIPDGPHHSGLSVTGVMLIDAETPERRAIDWRILGGGIVSASSYRRSELQIFRLPRRSSSSSRWPSSARCWCW